jgi:beta-glucosidase
VGAAGERISRRVGQGGAGIPILFGVDAVHGHSNLPGATIFPHNIGLGAMHDPALVQRIGAATADEIAATGIEWTFAPTLAVPQDLRWGRSYEGYAADPALVAAYGRAMVTGLQGPLRAGLSVDSTHVAATAKHYLADGGTFEGKDQGDARIGEAELIARHAQGYPAAIDAGALTVMASFSSWNGVKNHGNRSLLTDVLKGRMGFGGFVVGDWNGHGQVEGCTVTSCAASFNAGLDMAMAPDSWKGLFDTTLAQAQQGAIPMARIDDAVRRILRVKFKLGLMGAAPVLRGAPDQLGAPAHLAVAREAVAKSLVLLKNNGGLLPLKPGAKVLVAGPGPTAWRCRPAAGRSPGRAPTPRPPISRAARRSGAAWSMPWPRPVARPPSRPMGSSPTGPMSPWSSMARRPMPNSRATWPISRSARAMAKMR